MIVNTLNIIGLLMNAAGVILLFLFAMPFRTRTGGYTVRITEGSDPEMVRVEGWFDKLGWLGLGLIVLGTVVQIIAILWPTSQGWVGRSFGF
jgi:hypothetical protein